MKLLIICIPIFVLSTGVFGQDQTDIKSQDKTNTNVSKPNINTNGSQVKSSTNQLQENKSYRLEKNIFVDQLSSGCTESNKHKFAGKESKFRVVYKMEDCYIIQFWSTHSDNSGENSNTVKEYDEYVLSPMINGVPIEKSTSKAGRTSGLLVVPYKLREGDGSLIGDATVGYYAGWEKSGGKIIFSAGISQISIPISKTETETQSAISVATGYLFTDWDGVDMGIVLGFDHIGGSKGDEWKFEDRPWLSIMIGWNFSQ